MISRCDYRDFFACLFFCYIYRSSLLLSYPSADIGLYDFILSIYITEVGRLPLFFSPAAFKNLITKFIEYGRDNWLCMCGLLLLLQPCKLMVRKAQAFR